MLAKSRYTRIPSKKISSLQIAATAQQPGTLAFLSTSLMFSQFCRHKTHFVVMRGVTDENEFLRSMPPDRYYELRFNIEKIVEISIKPMY